MQTELVEKATKLIENGEMSDYEIARQLSTNQQKVTRSAIQRLRKKLNLKVKTFLDRLTPEERDIYMDYVSQKVNDDTDSSKSWFSRLFPIRRTAADPPITTFDGTEMPSMSEHNNFLNYYTPQYDIQPIDVRVDKNNEIISQGPFAAKSIKDKTSTYPRYFLNQYTALDYILYQNIWMTTVCGSIIDILTAFTMGRGIRPILKLNRNADIPLKTINGKQESKDEAEARIIDENESLLDPIIAIDKSFSDPDQKDPYLDEDFNTKIESLIRNHWIYGRCMLLKESFDEYTFEWEGKKYPKIPNVLKVIHPRDMGFVQIDQPTLKLKGIQLNYSTTIIPAEEMLFLEHLADSPIYLGKYYGYSKMQRMLGHGRSLRKLIDKDFPNVASVGYAGFSIVAFKRDKKGTNAESDQNQTFVNTMTVGLPNAASFVDPEHDVHVHQVDTDPKIREMIEMAHYHAEACAKINEVPTALVAKEKDPNRDTLLGILRLFIENVVKRHRSNIGAKIAAQHYMPNFRIIYEGKSEILDKFHIESEFDDYKLESWVDIVDSVVNLNQLFKLKTDANGELLGIPNLESKIDPDADPINPTQKFTDADGKTLEMKTTTPSKKKEQKIEEPELPEEPKKPKKPKEPVKPKEPAKPKDNSNKE